MEMPKPASGHERFEKFAGTWEGEEVMPPSQWDPQGGTATARNVFRVDLSGFALIGDYEQRRDGAVTFTGHGVMTFSPDDDKYTLHWFDCLGTPPEVFEGKFEGEVLAVSHGGPGMHARLTYDLTNPDQLVMKMEMSQDGKDWNKLFDGKYRRG